METAKGIFTNYPKAGGDSLAMSISQNIPVQDNFRFRSLIAIGHPILDISAEVDKESIQKYRLKWGETVFADESNIGFFKELESEPEVTYVPGGSIQNTLRVCSWCLNMEPNNQDKYSITMLGATGEDMYKEKIMHALQMAKVNPLLQAIPNMNTSRCGVGIYKKERCLLPEIRASNCLTEEFVTEHEKEIFENDALLIEGYFLQEKFDICKHLCMEFKKDKKFIILALSAVFMVQAHYDKIVEIANHADMVVGNIEELETFAGVKGVEKREIFEIVAKKLAEKERLFVVTDGSKGVLISKYDYNGNKVDFILQSFPSLMKTEEITDLNGAGDAFLGGFLSQFMKGSTLYSCCRAGNDAAYVILQNIGCTFPKDLKIQFGI
jgi:adenosine kinase